MKSMKRVLSFGLAVIMAVSMLPITASAEGTAPSCAQLDGCVDSVHNALCPLSCTLADSCTSGNHQEGCPEKVIPCNLEAACGAAEHDTQCLSHCTGAADCGAEAHKESCLTRCTTLADCGASAHKEGCQKALDDAKRALCDQTLDCTAELHKTPCEKVSAAIQAELNTRLAAMEEAWLAKSCLTQAEREQINAGLAAIAQYAQGNGVDLGEAQQAKYDALSQFRLDTPNVIAKIGDTPYGALSDAIAAVEAGGTVTLQDNITTADKLTISKNLTLDLGGKTLTYTGSSEALEIAASTAVTVQNGSVVSTADNAKGIRVRGSLIVAEGASVAGKLPAIFLNANASLTVSGTVTGGTAAIMGNGTEHDTSITIQGKASVTADNLAIYQPQRGSLSVNGGSVSAATAIYIKSGTLNVAGGTISGTGTKQAYDYHGSGANSTGDAIVIDNCGYPGGAPSAVLGGGSITSSNASAIGAYYNKDASAIASITKAAAFALAAPEGYTWKDSTTLTKVIASVGGKDITSTEELEAEITSITASGNPVEAPASAATANTNTVDAAIITAIKDTGNTSVKLSIPTAGAAKVELDATATQTVVNTATTGSAEPNVVLNVTSGAAPSGFAAGAAAYELTLTVGGSNVHSFGTNAKAKVTLPLPSNFPNVDKIIVSYVEGGTKQNESFEATVNSDKTVTFFTGHFSTFVVEPALASIEDNKYPTLEQALTAAADGDKIVLNGDITLTSDITVAKSITLDLGGKTLSGDFSIIAQSGDITIQNGTVKSKHTFSGTLTTNLLIKGSAKVTAKNVTFQDADYGIRIEKDAASASFTLESGSITAKTFGIVVWSNAGSNSVTVNGGIITAPTGISGNGTSAKDTTIIINGGTISATHTGIYHPQKGTLTVYKGTITGNTGIEMRGGSVQVFGGTITGTGSYSAKSEGSGGTTTGAGIALSPYGANQVTAMINGGTISGDAAIAINNLDGNTGTADSSRIDVTVLGGSLSGDLELDASAVSQSGIFRDPKVALDAPAGYTWVSNGGISMLIAQTDVENPANKDVFTTFTITAAWVDYNNAWSKRPASQKVDLYFNDSKTVSQSVTLSAANNWKETLTVWAKYYTSETDPGKDTKIAIVPAAVTNYATTQTGDLKTGFTITNTLTAQTYTITKGAEQKVVIGSAATFISNADKAKFAKVLVDNKEVAADNYIVESGSTKVTLKSAFVKSLGLGEHTLSIVSTDGIASTFFTVKHPTVYVYDPDKLLQTGQLNWPIPVMATLGTAALAVGLWFLLAQKKERYEG